MRSARAAGSDSGRRPTHVPVQVVMIDGSEIVFLNFISRKTMSYLSMNVLLCIEKVRLLVYH